MQISRRNALLGATAAAVVTGAATAPLAIKAAGVKAALASEPLVALEAELIEARAARDKVAALWSAAYDKAGAWAFGWPKADFSCPAMSKLSGWFHSDRIDLDSIKAYNRHTQELVKDLPEFLAQRKAAGRARIRWWIKARRAQRAAQETAGVSQLDALLERKHERVDAIEDQLWDTPAETLRGVLIRLREAHRDYVAVNCSTDTESDFYAVAFGKVLRDLERLARGMPS